GGLDAAAAAAAAGLFTGQSAATDSTGGVRDLYRRACSIGKFKEGVDLIRTAAKLRPLFTASEEFTGRTQPIQLAAGPASPVLVGVPSMVAPSGPHNFARLALHLHGRRAVHGLSLPGFGEGDMMPASAEVTIDLMADIVTRNFTDAPFALAGYSAGGWLAHAIATRIEERGGRAAAVILLDTWFPGDRIPENEVNEELRGIAVNNQAYALITEAQVTAQGGYLDLFDGWRPSEIETPIVLVRAMERPPQQPENGDDPDAPDNEEWKLSHDTVEVHGDHQTMMNEHAESTAAAIHHWLLGLDRR
ncbi:thioesterase domain-containing protein, partial [Frankia sp. AiPs1]|uniref:thioesterase domain-containing protein n=1 Tax=Frankia sp. AiPs1 TaxID=573493 RepID=UPI002042F18C